MIKMGFYWLLRALYLLFFRLPGIRCIKTSKKQKQGNVLRARLAGFVAKKNVVQLVSH